MDYGLKVLLILAVIKLGIDLIHKLVVKKPYDEYKFRGFKRTNPFQEQKGDSDEEK